MDRIPGRTDAPGVCAGAFQRGFVADCSFRGQWRSDLLHPPLTICGRIAGEVAKSAATWQKEVAPSANRHEVFESGHQQRAFRRRDCQSPPFAAAAEDRIDFTVKTMKQSGAGPRLLNEFELTLDIRIEAHEQQSWVSPLPPAQLLRCVRSTDA